MISHHQIILYKYRIGRMICRGFCDTMLPTFKKEEEKRKQEKLLMKWNQQQILLQQQQELQQQQQSQSDEGNLPVLSHDNIQNNEVQHGYRTNNNSRQSNRSGASSNGGSSGKEISDHDVEEILVMDKETAENMSKPNPLQGSELDALFSNTNVNANEDLKNTSNNNLVTKASNQDPKAQSSIKNTTAIASTFNTSDNNSSQQSPNDPKFKIELRGGNMTSDDSSCSERGGKLDDVMEEYSDDERNLSRKKYLCSDTYYTIDDLRIQWDTPWVADSASIHGEEEEEFDELRRLPSEVTSVDEEFSLLTNEKSSLASSKVTRKKSFSKRGMKGSGGHGGTKLRRKSSKKRYTGIGSSGRSKKKGIMAHSAGSQDESRGSISASSSTSSLFSPNQSLVSLRAITGVEVSESPHNLLRRGSDDERDHDQHDQSMSLSGAGLTARSGAGSSVYNSKRKNGPTVRESIPPFSDLLKPVGVDLETMSLQLSATGRHTVTSVSGSTASKQSITKKNQKSKRMINALPRRQPVSMTLGMPEVLLASTAPVITQRPQKVRPAPLSPRARGILRRRSSSSSDNEDHRSRTVGDREGLVEGGSLFSGDDSEKNESDHMKKEVFITRNNNSAHVTDLSNMTSEQLNMINNRRRKLSSGLYSIKSYDSNNNDHSRNNSRNDSRRPSLYGSSPDYADDAARLRARQEIIRISKSIVAENDELLSGNKSLLSDPMYHRSSSSYDFIRRRIVQIGQNQSDSPESRSASVSPEMFTPSSTLKPMNEFTTWKHMDTSKVTEFRVIMRDSESNTVEVIRIDPSSLQPIVSPAITPTPKTPDEEELERMAKELRRKQRRERREARQKANSSTNNIMSHIQGGNSPDSPSSDYLRSPRGSITGLNSELMQLQSNGLIDNLSSQNIASLNDTQHTLTDSTQTLQTDYSRSFMLRSNLLGGLDSHNRELRRMNKLDMNATDILPVAANPITNELPAGDVKSQPDDPTLTPRRPRSLSIALAGQPRSDVSGNDSVDMGSLPGVDDTPRSPPKYQLFPSLNDDILEGHDPVPDHSTRKGSEVEDIAAQLTAQVVASTVLSTPPPGRRPSLTLVSMDGTSVLSSGFTNDNNNAVRRNSLGRLSNEVPPLTLSKRLSNSTYGARRKSTGESPPKGQRGAEHPWKSYSYDTSEENSTRGGTKHHRISHRDHGGVDADGEDMNDDDMDEDSLSESSYCSRGGTRYHALPKSRNRSPFEGAGTIVYLSDELMRKGTLQNRLNHRRESVDTSGLNLDSNRLTENDSLLDGGGNRKGSAGTIRKLSKPLISNSSTTLKLVLPTAPAARDLVNLLEYYDRESSDIRKNDRNLNSSSDDNGMMGRGGGAGGGPPPYLQMRRSGYDLKYSLKDSVDLADLSSRTQVPLEDTLIIKKRSKKKRFHHRTAEVDYNDDMIPIQDRIIFHPLSEGVARPGFSPIAPKLVSFCSPNLVVDENENRYVSPPRNVGQSSPPRQRTGSPSAVRPASPTQRGFILPQSSAPTAVPAEVQQESHTVLSVPVGTIVQPGMQKEVTENQSIQVNSNINNNNLEPSKLSILKLFDKLPTKKNKIIDKKLNNNTIKKSTVTNNISLNSNKLTESNLPPQQTNQTIVINSISTAKKEVEPKRGLVQVNQLFSPVKVGFLTKADSLRAEVVSSRAPSSPPENNAMQFNPNFMSVDGVANIATLLDTSNGLHTVPQKTEGGSVVQARRPTLVEPDIDTFKRLELASRGGISTAGTSAFAGATKTGAEESNVNESNFHLKHTLARALRVSSRLALHPSIDGDMVEVELSPRSTGHYPQPPGYDKRSKMTSSIRRERLIFEGALEAAIRRNEERVKEKLDGRKRTFSDRKYSS